jgi:hypothetical protein
MGEDGLGDLDGKSFDELYQYYRAIYQHVTEDALQEWEKKYPGSSMEKDDLRDYYNKHEGSMSKVKDYIPFVEEEDLWRVKEAVDAMIESGELQVRFLLALPSPQPRNPQRRRARRHASRARLRRADGSRTRRSGRPSTPSSSPGSSPPRPSPA